METDSFIIRACKAYVFSDFRIVLTSGLSWAYILGEVCAIVSEMTAESQRFRKKMHHLCLFGSSLEAF